MRTKDDIKKDLLESRLYLWGASLFGFNEEDFQHVWVLTRQYFFLCRHDNCIDKEMTLIFLNILNIIWNNSIDATQGTMDPENLMRHGKYFRLLTNEVFSSS